jgi:transposase
MNYTHFVGIDVGKNSLVIAFDGDKKSHTVPNNTAAITKFIANHAAKFSAALVVLEATGGYETQCIHILIDRNISVHRASTLQAMHFRRSLKTRAKNDSIDAFALARYGAERGQTLTLFSMPDAEQLQLQEYLARRDDLVRMRTSEKARAKHPRYRKTRDSIVRVLAFLDGEIAIYEQKIADLTKNSENLKRKAAVLTQIPGIGAKTAEVLLGYMPELGTLDRKQAASLAGVAPHPRESGNFMGDRSTSGGRFTVRKARFMAAMAARTAKNGGMKAFFLRLTENGKKPMVALVAVMRKLIVIANARLRDIDKPPREGANSL